MTSVAARPDAAAPPDLTPPAPEHLDTAVRFFSIGYDLGEHVGRSTEGIAAGARAFDLGRRVGYREGRADGYLDGFAAGGSENYTLHAEQLVRWLAKTPSYAERCEGAGEHQRAARARQITEAREPAGVEQ